MQNSHQNSVQFDTTTKIQPNYQDNDSNIDEQDTKLFDLFEHLKQFALNINNIIQIPKKTEANKLRLIKEATQTLDFQGLQQLAALEVLHPVAPEDDFEEDPIQEIKRERDEYKRKVELLQTEIQKGSHHQNIQLINSLDQALLRLTDKRSSYQDQEKLIQLQQAEIENQKAKVKQLNELNQEFIRKEIELETQIEDYKHKASNNQEYLAEKSKNARLQQELKQKAGTIEIQRKVLDGLNEQVKRLNARINQLETDRQQLRHQNTKLAEGNSSNQTVLNEYVNKLRHQLAQKETEVSQLSLQFQQQSEQMTSNNARISSLTVQLEQRNNQISILKQIKSDLQSQIKSGNQKCNQLKSQKQKAQLQVKALRVYQEEFAQLKNVCHTLKNELSQPTQKRICDQIRHHSQHLQKKAKEQFKTKIMTILASK